MTEQERERLANFSRHAGRIAALLETPRGDDFDVLHWRAVYFHPGETVSDSPKLRVTKESELRVVGVMIRAETITTAGNGTGYFEVKQAYRSVAATEESNGVQVIGSPILSAEEIAVFLGLEGVEQDAIEWVEQRDPVKVRAQKAGLVSVGKRSMILPGKQGFQG